MDKLIFTKQTEKPKEKYLVARISQKAVEKAANIARKTELPLSKVISEMVLFAEKYTETVNDKEK